MSSKMNIPIRVVNFRIHRDHEELVLVGSTKKEFVAGDVDETIVVRLPDGSLWKLKAPQGMTQALLAEWVEPTRKKRAAAKKTTRKKKS